ncbi:NADH-quinone oxidoreductase subunit NuoE [Phreatobacter sp. AB_2022a]|uniref:NADH-quinone oxidoreductase subunit NuoE n=1 Tax=Phreatobacter sp. AB_2022a TaxID=3003134 RepID=UPI000570385E|nr:NADH-quinone oxidoreductase subunit NuoE [Phreatobacter sp. AB_2022a]MCZ0738270.1 NADH-quinone oxidoreductase subunit NuoE [Phreatobacter sp. AB_2022a]CEJ13220.1 NADH-quinone oxidoreductase chain 2 [bacterium YEK0313]
MSVRRLAPDEVQPASFAFTAENLAWARETIGKYPAERKASAVIPLLWRAQEQHAYWLPKAAIEYIADMLDMPYIRVFEVATFYTMFQLQPVGTKAHVQVCGTTPCMLRGAEELIKVCKSRIHAEPFHLSADGAFSWEEVECAGACVNAPMIQVFSDTYEDLTPESLEKVLDAFARGEKPKPGPQNGRHGAEPEGGALTLHDLPFNAATPGGDGAPRKAPAKKAPAADAPSVKE